MQTEGGNAPFSMPSPDGNAGFCRIPRTPGRTGGTRADGDGTRQSTRRRGAVAKREGAVPGGPVSERAQRERDARMHMYSGSAGGDGHGTDGEAAIPGGPVPGCARSRARWTDAGVRRRGTHGGRRACARLRHGRRTDVPGGPGVSAGPVPRRDQCLRGAGVSAGLRRPGACAAGRRGAPVRGRPVGGRGRAGRSGVPREWTEFAVHVGAVRGRHGGSAAVGDRCVTGRPARGRPVRARSGVRLRPAPVGAGR